MTHISRVIPVALAYCVAIPAIAQTSQPAARADVGAPTSSNATAEASVTGAGTPFDAPVVDAATLSTVTGKADLATVISAKNTSNVSNNSVSGNSVTGSIAFDSSSFSGLNGLSLLSANTGNNVAINSSLNVNVVIRP